MPLLAISLGGFHGRGKQARDRDIPNHLNDMELWDVLMDVC